MGIMRRRDREVTWAVAMTQMKDDGSWTRVMDWRLGEIMGTMEG